MMSDEVAKKRTDPPWINHRQRIKERFDKTGFSGFAEHEILEMFLFYLIPRRDTKPIAKRLLMEFGSIEGVFAAKPERLMQIPGLGKQAPRYFAMFRELSEIILKRKSIPEGKPISSIADVLNYLGGSMANLPEEQFRVIFLDHSNRVIRDEIFSQGTEDQTVVFPKQIMKRALALYSTAIIVAHNHPSGMVSPSQADRDITRALHAAGLTLDIRLLDHIIIGREGKGYFSFRENRLIPS